MESIKDKAESKVRLRAHHLLRNDSGAVVHIYDLERTMIFDVPAQFQQYGSLSAVSAEMKTWLKEKDVITTQSFVSWADSSLPELPTLTDLSMDMSGACNLACTYCFENDIHSRIGGMKVGTALSTLDYFFNQNQKAKKVALHFGSGEPLLRFDLLQIIVEEALARAERNNQKLSFELTTNASLVDEQIAHFFRSHSFNVRVSCDGPAELHNRYRPLKNGQGSYEQVEAGLKLLLHYIPNHLTVNSVISGGTRLLEIYNWARALDIAHHTVIKVGAYATKEELNLRTEELRLFQSDLNQICDDIFFDLEAGKQPYNYQPISKIIRRLMIPEPITRFCGVASTYLGVNAKGKVYPCFRHIGMGEYELGDVWDGINNEKRRAFLGAEAADVDNRPLCQDCWARYMCGGGCYADSTVYGPDKLQPQVQHCPFWKTEVETAIRFFRRLIHSNPSHCIKLFNDNVDDLIGALETGEINFLKRVNCS